MELVFSTICIVGIVIVVITIIALVVTDAYYPASCGIAFLVGVIMVVIGGIGWYNAAQDVKHSAEQEQGLTLIDTVTAGKKTYDRVSGVGNCKLPVDLIDGKFYIANSENSAPLTQKMVDDICSGGPR